MEEAAMHLAEGLAKYLSFENAGQRVTVELFRGQYGVVNQNLKTLVERGLESKGFQCVSAGAFTVEGRLTLVDVGNDQVAARINCKILDPFGAEKHQLGTIFTDTRDAISTLGPTFSNPADSAGPKASEITPLFSTTFRTRPFSPLASPRRLRYLNRSPWNHFSPPWNHLSPPQRPAP
jgi:hypothetical protein